MAARTKKAKENAPEAVEPVAPKRISLRDENGLLKGVTYHFKPNGLIDWRKMISPEHIVVNRFVAAGKGLEIDNLSPEILAKLVEEAKEEDLVIKLGGFREIAGIRGYSRLDSKIETDNPDKVVVKVTIDWIANFETNADNLWDNGYSVSAIASASRENTDEKFAKYLETIAENRAFVRAVRHSLGIIAVGQDEIKQEDVKTEVRNTKIHSLLYDLMSKLTTKGENFDFVALQVFAQEQGIDWNDKWSSVEKIDPAAVMTLIPLLKKIVG